MIIHNTDELRRLSLSLISFVYNFLSCFIYQRFVNFVLFFYLLSLSLILGGIYICCIAIR